MYCIRLNPKYFINGQLATKSRIGERSTTISLEGSMLKRAEMDWPKSQIKNIWDMDKI